MSIETKLKDEFEQVKQAVSCPPSMDSRMMALYRAHMVQKRGKQPMLGKRKWSKLAIVSVAAAVLFGFAYAGGAILFQESKGNVSITAKLSSQTMKVDKEKLTAMSQTLADVKKQLNLGETALVYFAEGKGEQIYGGNHAFPVSNPEITLEREAWKQLIPYQPVADAVPSHVLGNFKFAGGMKDSPYGSFFSHDYVTISDELKQESNETGKEVVWRKVTPSPNNTMEIYTSMYRNTQQQSIDIMVTTYKEKVSVEAVLASSIDYEKLNINGKQAFYMNGDLNIHSASHSYKEVKWLEVHGEDTFMYQVATDSLDITKEQLIQAAKELN